ncbi:MAG TPA: family 1 glycosylhydrolase [Oscillatoriaceae cyanobacterium]
MPFLSTLAAHAADALEKSARPATVIERRASDTVVPAIAKDALALSAPAPAARHLWSRATQTDAKGFFRMPAGICDDFEDTDLSAKTKQQIAEDFKTMKDVGVKEMRLGMSWCRIQTGKNEYDWSFWDYLVNTANKQGIRLMPYICYTPEWVGDHTPDFWHHPPTNLNAFADFAETAAKRYKGKITSWELWNEPDNAAYWQAPGTAEQSADTFAKMLTPAIERLRKVDPSAGLILGGMSVGRGPFFDRLMTKYHLGDRVDAVNVHAYYRTWNEGPEESLTAHLQGMKELIDQTTGKAKPALNLDEFGYSSHRYSQTQASQWGNQLIYNYEHTPAYQGEELFKDHTTALASGTTSHVAWYRIRDLQPSTGVIGDNNNLYLGLLDPQGKPKPAFDAMKFFNQLFDQPTRSLDGKVKIQAPADSQAQVHVLQKKDGKVVVVGWLRDSSPSEVADKSGMATDTRQESVSIQFPGLKLSKLSQFDSAGKAVSTGAQLKSGVLSNVPLRGDRVFVAELTP